jgi:exopolysaccharide biosynthesis WecB/TagA/CpsF family protein
LLKVKNNEYEKLNITITRMRTGGASGKNLAAHLSSGLEIYKSLKERGFSPSHFMINLRYVIKLKQFFFTRKNLAFKINNYYEKLNRYHFRILSNVKLLNFKKNFTLSALNLAFLGSYSNKEVKTYKSLIHWPDGRFSKSISKTLKKVPGRFIINSLKIPKTIKKIVIFGNLPEKSKEFIEKKFNKSIVNYNLPYDSINRIVKKIFYKIKKNELILITLPTPKQEQLAEHLVLRNKNYKIICIGGSINIASGIEKPVPNIFYNLEFLWRLRYETNRRLKRLLITMYYYSLGKFLNKRLTNLNIKIIN